LKQFFATPNQVKARIEPQFRKALVCDNERGGELNAEADRLYLFLGSRNRATMAKNYLNQMSWGHVTWYSKSDPKHGFELLLKTDVIPKTPASTRPRVRELSQCRTDRNAGSNKLEAFGTYTAELCQ